jgi:TolB-like protein
MSRRTIRSDANSVQAAQCGAATPNIPARSPRRRDAEPLKPSDPMASKSRWRCLLSNIAVAVAPLRNLTGDVDQDRFLDSFANDLATDLSQQGHGFSLRHLATEPDNLGKFTARSEPDVKYLVSGSVQRGSPGKLRVNVRIADAATSEYLWARRYEFGTEEAALNQTKIIRRISRELHILLLQKEIGRVVSEWGAGQDLNECLACVATALERELRPDLTAEAQRWYLAALADDPRNVEALTGLARTCQELVSNPWWGDPLAAAVASDIGREMVAIALDLAPGAVDARCVQGMLHSAAGKLHDAARAFESALEMDYGLAIAHGFAAYNGAFLGSAGNTLPAIETAMRLDHTDRRHSIWFFFGGFAELLIGHTDVSISLLQKSLERNRSYGSARLFLIAALSLSGRHREAAEAAFLFREQYPDCPAGAFDQLWLSRSASATYRAQILPVFETIRNFGVGI